MQKKTYIEKKVGCYYNIHNGVTLEQCKDCGFFNGFINKDDSKVSELEDYNENEVIGVDCLRGEIGNIGAHVTSFTSNGYLYKSRHYDEDIDGEIEDDDPYNYCRKCCFNKTLVNGKEVCTLRCGIDNSESTNFICYEGEIWEKEKIEDTND